MCFLIPGSQWIPGAEAIALGHGRTPPYGAAAKLFPLAKTALDDERLEEYARCFLMHDSTHHAGENRAQDAQLLVLYKVEDILFAGDLREDGSPSPEITENIAEKWDTEIRPEIQKCKAR